MAVDIDAAAQVMENHATNLDGEAQKFDDAAAQFVTAAQQAAQQVMADAKTRATQLVQDAQNRAAKETAQAQTKRDEAAYWRNLAQTERHKAANGTADTVTDQTGALPLPPQDGAR